MIRWRILRPFDPWQSPLCTCPFKYTVNPYTGCGHGCLYCYASSYIKDFFRPRPKENILINVRKDLQNLPKGSVVELSASSDPFQPLEEKYGLTYKVSREILLKGHKILYTTKAPNILLKYKDLLEEFKGKIAVAVTITTFRDDLAKKLEPNAPPPSVRIDAVRKLSEMKIPVAVRIDPVIPYINDDPKDLEELIKIIADAGALQITSSTYKAKPDNFRRLTEVFKDLRDKLYQLYYVEGEYIRGYRYLPKKIRYELMTLIKKYAVENNLKFATCREGFAELNTPDTICDGSGFIRRTINKS
ncbi:MAG: DUF1848 family protein [Desulfurococcaceae archaeon]|nr:DUF1848 family protein [Desulfurococcaceae archaeon]